MKKICKCSLLVVCAIALTFSSGCIKKNNKIDYYVLSDAVLSFYGKENV